MGVEVGFMVFMQERTWITIRLMVGLDPIETVLATFTMSFDSLSIEN